MRHWKANNTTCEHYAVGHNQDHVFVQLQDARAEQIRIRIPVEYAKHLIELLELNIAKAEEHTAI
jgi:hypothetical protein